MGRPAASALVQPAGRSWFEPRSQTAPEPACQVPPLRLSCREQLVQLAGALVDHEHVPVAAALDACGFDGMGYLTRSDSSGHWNVTVLRGVRRRHDVPGDAVAAVRAEVRMQRRVQADGRLERLRVGAHRQRVDALVPDVGRLGRCGRPARPGPRTAAAAARARRRSAPGWPPARSTITERGRRRGGVGGMWRIVVGATGRRHPPLGLEGPVTRVWLQ